MGASDWSALTVLLEQRIHYPSHGISWQHTRQKSNALCGKLLMRSLSKKTLLSLHSSILPTTANIAFIAETHGFCSWHFTDWALLINMLQNEELGIWLEMQLPMTCFLFEMCMQLAILKNYSCHVERQQEALKEKKLRKQAVHLNCSVLSISIYEEQGNAKLKSNHWV